MALPGVQVLFAFLLTVPFSARFGSITPLQEVVFFATLVCAALSAALLLAPSAHHRLLWRCHARERRLRVAVAHEELDLHYTPKSMVRG